MYKVIFIDDEAITLRLLECAIDWERYEIEIAGTALDGKEGIELLKAVKPDIVIADIRMPNMTGVEFAEKVRSFDQDVKIVLLSAYAEFEYAQKAITFGISEYLLKPLDETKLEHLIQKLIIELEEKRKVQQTVIDYHNRTEEEQLRNGYMRYLEHGIEESPLSHSYNICLCILLLLLQGEEDAPFPDDQAIAVLKERINCEYLAISLHPGEIILLTNAAISVQEIVQYYKQAQIDVAIGIGESSSLYQAIKQAEQAAEQTFWSTVKIVQYYTDNSHGKAVLQNFDIWNRSIRHLVEQGQKKDLICQIDNLIKAAENDHMPPRDLYIYLQDVFDNLKVEMLQKYSGRPFIKKAIPHIDYYRLRACGSKAKLHLFLSSTLEHLAEEILKEQNNNSEVNVVRKAREYTEANYYRSTFSLQETADYVGLSKNHFSRVFHTNTGVKFWDYVTQKRIEKACQMLKKDYSVYEICQAVGYETESHFNKKFKQLEGITPGRYRKLYH